MTLSSPLSFQQLKLENIINYDAQSQQRQSLAAIGQRYTDIVWAAGLFEGEGSITHAANYPHKKQLSIGMTDKDVMERFVDVVGHGKLYGPYCYKKSGNRKPYWQWKAYKSSEILRILKMFLPHFGKRRAEKAIEAINHLHETIN